MSSDNQSDRQWMTGQAHPAIVLVGAPTLREGGHPVTDFAEASEIADRMTGLLRELNGAGLAAPQIGVAKAIIVVEVRKTDLFPDRPVSPLIVMVNPRIISASEEVETGWEGCFSVPGLMGLVDRHKTIEVEYDDVNGAAQTGRYDGYLGRVLQHEIDHLTGTVFLARMTSMDSITTVANYQLHHAAPTISSPELGN